MAHKERLINGLLCEYELEGIFISGNTFANKELLKQHGAAWVPEKKVWSFPLGTDISFLRLPPPPPPRPPVQKVHRTWICAKKKSTLDPDNPQGPLLWVCECHGTWKSDYDGT
jgi:hypothetical protein